LVSFGVVGPGQCRGTTGIIDEHRGLIIGPRGI
jgi:hypothetical protein